MTDEIRITRRIALEKMYEYYEIQWTTDNTEILPIITKIEERIEDIRILANLPSPEISPKIDNDDPYPGLLFYDAESNTVRPTNYIKDKEKWAEINTHLRGLGYKWVSAGKDSRWER